MDEPAEVRVEGGVPVRVNGQPVSHLIDSYRVWPKWWEGYAPRDYYLLQVGERTLEVYQTLEVWFLARVVD